MMTGQFSIQGTVTNDPTTHVLAVIPQSVETGFGTQTGTFAALLTNNEHPSPGTATISYDPYIAGSSYFVIGSLAATVENLTETISMPDGDTVYGFSGNALLSAAGYDVTPGSFTFSTQDSGAVTFSATTLTSSAVPEPSTLALFGTGIFGLAGIISRKIRA